MKHTSRCWKTGNGLVITIPKVIKEQMDLKVGSVIEVDFKIPKD